MGADNTWSGRVTITPPLTWQECKVSPGVEDVRLEISEKDGPDGRILTAVAVVPARPSDSWSAGTGQELQFLIDSHSGHDFAGALFVDWKPVYGEGQVLSERWAVHGRTVVHEEARLVWGPADGEAIPPAAHRIRIYDHKPWHRPNYSVSHPAACDALRYGEKCWLDALIEQYVDALVDPRHDWPDKGRYTVTAPAEGETSLQFTPIDGES